MDIAKDYGLDFYEMRFEVVPADVLYTFGAYGMPTRFTHWSFGKTFQKMKMSYDYNLSRIYELVINSDPCYAFLLEGNRPIQNELVSAHVLAHCDFFKNNAAYAGTSRFMVESMASSAERIRKYELEQGRQEVEKFLDAALALQEHIDPYHRTIKEVKEKKESPPQSSRYDDLFQLEDKLAKKERDEAKVSKEKTSSDSKSKILSHSETNEKKEENESSTKKLSPQKDVLLFLMKEGRFLEEWQQDILSIIRDEMLYFWPQLRTKIMNEGWASYWHLRIMREMEMTENDAWEFAKMHAQVVQPSRLSINPYYVGLKMFEDIEKRYGREKMFEVREVETDQSFLRNYLTKELVHDLDLYIYKKVGNQWQVIEKNWEVVRDQLVDKLTNGGFPTIYVEDGDFNRAGELYLRHAYEGVELDIPYLERTIPYLYTFWQRPVHLETMIDGKKVLFTYNGEKVTRKYQ
ncbi:SpoVR family protein [Heliorestis convoluta]